MNDKNITFDNLPMAVNEILTKLENIEYLITALPKVQSNTLDSEPYIYGIKGLADFLHITTVTAQRIKNSGKIPFSQAERTIIFQKDQVLNSLSNFKLNNKTKRK